MKVKRTYELPVDVKASLIRVDCVAAMLIEAAQADGCLAAECEYDGVTLYATRESTVESIREDYARVKARWLHRSPFPRFRNRTRFGS